MNTEFVSSVLGVLSLEKKRGFSNRAVIGGLDIYLKRIAPRIKEMINDRATHKKYLALEFAKTNYGSLGIEERESFLFNVTALLKEIEVSSTSMLNASTRQEQFSLKKIGGKEPGKATESGCDLNSSVKMISGISDKTALRLYKLGVRSIRDILYLLPRRHLDYANLKTISEITKGNEQTMIGTIWESRAIGLGRYAGTEAVVGDATGNIRAVWFNRPYLAKSFIVNRKVLLSGKVSLYRGQRVFESPEWEVLEGQELIHAGRLVPVYPLTEGLNQRQMRKIVRRAIDDNLPNIVDFLPEFIKTRNQVMSLQDAILQAHYPDNIDLKNKSRERLAFDELFLLQLGIMSKKRDWKTGQPAKPFQIDPEFLIKYKKSLPFSLTSAQVKVLAEISTDLNQEKAMSRLLQGEVGSGKTVLAIAATLIAYQNGFQSAFMAPTEILAEQHFSSIKKILSGMFQCVQDTADSATFSNSSGNKLNISLLVGSFTGMVKKNKRDDIKQGKINIIIGTHAIMQEGVEFFNLGLVLIDEQQRFGVMQRATLCQKGHNPHLLIITATPIPRTLALTLFGDLDISVINELPPGRQKIRTRYLEPTQRETAYEIIRNEVKNGRQAFVICPLIDESDVIQTKAAIVEYKNLSSGAFAGLDVGLLHGRMSAEDKDRIMREFRDGKYHILVSTPVIEVGIDIPNATVMLIEGAERFGLSQLHQFRGRVGRGHHQSYCILLAQNPAPEARDRLSTMEKVHDGFTLAEMDLRIRGPGEFFGTRQSGLPDLKVAMVTDTRILELARSEAIRVLNLDPKLSKVENLPLARELTRLWNND